MFWDFWCIQVNAESLNGELCRWIPFWIYCLIDKIEHRPNSANFIDPLEPLHWFHNEIDWFKCSTNIHMLFFFCLSQFVAVCSTAVLQAFDPENGGQWETSRFLSNWNSTYNDFLIGLLLVFLFLYLFDSIEVFVFVACVFRFLRPFSFSSSFFVSYSFPLSLYFLVFLYFPLFHKFLTRFVDFFHWKNRLFVLEPNCERAQIGCDLWFGLINGQQNVRRFK